VRDGITLDHPTQKVVLVQNELKNSLNITQPEHVVLVPKNIKVNITNTGTRTKRGHKVASTQQSVMSVKDFEHQYHTVTAEEAYGLTKKQKMIQGLGVVLTGGLLGAAVPALIRSAGYKFAQGIMVASDIPEVTKTFMEEEPFLEEEAYLYMPGGR